MTTKPFTLLTGLSGSGKTKIAQAFAKWICEDKEQYRIVPVGADWTSREPLLGYVNAIEQDKYVSPENGVLDLLIEANKDENKEKPYFLILDEMNLSHVERYFADFLSVMESDDKFRLHNSKTVLKSQSGQDIEQEYGWPENLYVIGTVNIDETTYMFSPKVLDRANTIEFRVEDSDIAGFLNERKKIDLSQLEAKGVSYAKSFIDKSQEGKDINLEKKEQDVLVKFFKKLKEVGAEFGFRTANEISVLHYHLTTFGLKPEEAMDVAIMQKLLPKLHGSRRKLVTVLQTLAGLCIDGNVESKTEILSATKPLDYSNAKYPISLEKLWRMHKNVTENGFTSYAEA
jgi:5-methylcytosine-specific restriction protein B